MIPLPNCQEVLLEIIELLETGGDLGFAAAVRGELDGSTDSLRSFLVSNNLWGGAGSLADSAFAFGSQSNGPDRPKNRAEFERLMIKLGRIQIASEYVNVRTEMWVEAFEHWRDVGIRSRKYPIDPSI